MYTALYTFMYNDPLRSDSLYIENKVKTRKRLLRNSQSFATKIHTQIISEDGLDAAFDKPPYILFNVMPLRIAAGIVLTGRRKQTACSLKSSARFLVRV